MPKPGLPPLAHLGNRDNSDHPQVTIPGVITRTAQRLRLHRYLNILGFFLPLGLALGLGGAVTLASVSWPLALLLGPLGGWAFFFCKALRHVHIGHQTAAVLLDKKTQSKERFLTLATIAQPPDRMAILLQRDAAGRAAFFVPERDVPFQLDRRVPIGLLVSSLCVAGALGLFWPPSQPISALLSPGLNPSHKPLQLAELEKKARELTAQGNTPQEQAAGTELVAPVKRLRASGLGRHEKELLIGEAEQRIKLDIRLPQLLPIDLKLFATESRNDGAGGNQKQDLAKQAQSRGPNTRSSVAEGTQAGQQRRDNGPSEGDQNRQTEPPQESGGIQFEQPERRGHQQHPADHQADGARRVSSRHDPTQRPQGDDPNIPGEQHRPDRNTPGPQSDPNRAGPTERGRGKDPSQGKALVQAGEKSGGFLTKDMRFVKVRVPVGEADQSDTRQRTANTSPARPITPYSNAPLTDRQRGPTPARQPIPLEYRSLLNGADDADHRTE